MNPRGKKRKKSPVPFKYSPEELLFLFHFSGISFPYHFGTKEFSPGLLETPLENRGLSRWSKKKLESSRMLSRCLLVRGKTGK